MPACFGGSGEIPPEYYLRNFALCLGAHTITYLLLRVFVRIVLRVLPNILGLIVNSILEVILVIGIIRRYLDYPSASLDSSNLLA
jgi:hypothetical protein